MQKLASFYLLEHAPMVASRRVLVAIGVGLLQAGVAMRQQKTVDKHLVRLGYGSVATPLFRVLAAMSF
jgi:hypothetical protein